jgi:hypothetical protein
MSNFRVKIVTILLQLLTLALFSGVSFSQSSSEKRKIFTQAETYFLFQEYELANPLFLILDNQSNMNIKYKIGTCYLNIPGEKGKAVTYLETAIKDASNEAKTDAYKEKRAPLDAYFSLAKAYMIGNDFEKALKTLETFKKLVYETSITGAMKNISFIDQQIQACKVALRLKLEPVKFSRKSLGSDFNQGAINENAVVSFDGNTLAYTERRGMVNAIFFSKRKDGVWDPPKDITSDMAAGSDCSTCSLNSDGTELFIYKIDNYDGAIYSSLFKNGLWGPIKKLNKNINTKYYESHASISADGKKLYFTSNREGGLGNLDIYVSAKDGSGDWGPAENMGTTINTPFNDDTPFITENDSLLYFSSEGHSSMGGFDIFRSRRSGSSWETPVNLGFPINTSDNDRFFQPVDNDQNAYYSMTTGYKREEIFFLSLGGPRGNLFTEITGKVSLADTIMAFDKSFRIHLIDRTTGDTVDIGYPNKFTGTYSFYALPGNYRLAYTGIGYFTQTLDTAIARNELQVPVTFDISLARDLSAKRNTSGYDKINFKEIPAVAEMDTTILIKNLNVNDVNDKKVKDADILYYTVQVMALYKPADMNYFKFIPNVKVMYNDQDKFYRYTTGIFQTREEATARKAELIKKGYPDDIFIKKVSR